MVDMVGLYVTNYVCSVCDTDRQEILLEFTEVLVDSTGCGKERKRL